MLKKLGIFVGEDENWTFFKDIFEDLSTHYHTDIFKRPTIKNPLLPGRVKDWIYQEELRSVLKRNDVSFFEWTSELLSVASNMPKYGPIVARLHSFELAEWAYRINWDLVDKIIFVSEAIRTKFAEQFPAHANKTVVIYNAIAVDKFFPVPHPFDFSLGMLCTIKPIKRIYEIVLVVKELRDLGYSPKLYIGGPPANGNYQHRYYLAIRRLVEKFDLQEAVKFDGYVENPSVWLQKIDIYISNSYWEGLQTSLLEAMATGCYCLAHFWDGVEQVLPPDYIYVSETELKEKLISYSIFPEMERAKLKKQLVDIAHQKFDLKNKKGMIREVIESVK